MKILALILFTLLSVTSRAATYSATADDYTTYLDGLLAGDTLLLAPGDYTERLNLFSLVGTSTDPIVIIGSGDETVFLGNACCNTVSIKESAYIILKNFKIDGQNIDYIDGIKAEGTIDNWAHHIIIENILIVGHGANQSTVGISTKCPVWNWEIRNCIIDAAGTGMYLGNSDGEDPFVNGIIENNLIKNTIGYNLQIKHQNVDSRTIDGMTLDGKTIIRNNVFSKESNASTGGSARPNLLVGSFPETGDGANDYYEIYGNFFWQNPGESLFQGTGNIAFYDNVCVNYAGGNGVSIQIHNSFPPRDIKLFHNTIICESNWGIRFMNTDPAYEKYIYGNAVFSDHETPIRIVGEGIETANLLDNVVDVLDNANLYLNNPINDIGSIDLYPKTGSALNGTLIPNTPFISYLDYNKDFNFYSRSWNYRGAYAGEGTNPGWELEIEIKPVVEVGLGLYDSYDSIDNYIAYPNPTKGAVQLNLPFSSFKISVYNLHGQLIFEQENNNQLDFSELNSGIYLVQITTDELTQIVKIIRE